MQKMKFNVKAENQGLAITAKAGKHQIVLDEGAQMGGKDTGPNPMQNVLASLASCENVTAHVVAKEIGFDLQALSFNITGVFDPRGFMGDHSVRPYFEEVTVEVKVTTTEPPERIAALQAEVESRCPVYTLLKAADVKLKDKWESA
ncbi:OsmC family protein [Amphibacillus cookii]|uniref:OsmC family protein n=1 Tax=Amphibacillus cookii TaxID=767787 RepID=UPI001956F98D|nr:OsmC family protein [Amphibacillus cookii]MBM7540987.1 putative OsmC-like protein [Amphibacillus cookii]